MLVFINYWIEKCTVKHWNHNNTVQTQPLSHWFLFTYPCLALRSLSTHCLITNLHIFLSLSCSYLLAAGWWLSCSCTCFLPPWESQNVSTHCQKCCIFIILDNPATTELNFARMPGGGSLNRIKPGLFRGNRDVWNAYIFYWITFWK